MLVPETPKAIADIRPVGLLSSGKKLRVRRWAAAFAAVAALITATAAPSALAATTVTAANGSDLVLPDGDVYQLGDDGVYHLIPDVDTANAMHLDWNSLQRVDSLPGPVGDAYASVDASASATSPSTTLAAAPNVAVAPANGSDVILPDGDVYQLGDDGAYHLIPNVDTANAMHLDWNSLRQVDSLSGLVGAAYTSVD